MGPLVIFIFAVKSREGLQEWWELIMHFISMMDTARSTLNYISLEREEKSAWFSIESFEKCRQFSLSEDETVLTLNRKTVIWLFVTTLVQVGGFTFSQLNITHTNLKWSE